MTRSEREALLAAVMERLLLSPDCPCDLDGRWFGFQGGSVELSPAECGAVAEVLLVDYEPGRSWPWWPRA